MSLRTGSSIALEADASGRGLSNSRFRATLKSLHVTDWHSLDAEMNKARQEEPQKSDWSRPRLRFGKRPAACPP